MRVISGSCRGMTLQTPTGIDTRPTTDRIKETLFNMIAFDVTESNFLDLFSGSGQIGIEALSRGATSATFVENDRNAIKCIENNLAKTRLTDRTTLIRTDVFSALNTLRNHAVFDIIFMDPPYNKSIERNVLESIYDKEYINEETLIIVEASLDTDFDYIPSIGFSIVKEKCYKTNKHVFLKKGIRL